ncbi:MAG: flagellar basal body-associated FliL family protein [Planctomycetaceae bacterium]|nr:flagellar basal body-associated FliL family protein [Planctomycetaceae bacterium]
MADPQQTPEPPKQSSLLSMVLYLYVPLLAAGAGAAVPMLLTKGESTSVSEEELSQETVVISFGEVVANLSEGRMNRYLRLRISLLVSKDHQKELEEQLLVDGPLLKNWLLSHVSDKTVEDIRGKSGQNMLRREILDRVNHTLSKDGRDRVFDVLFEEFNVQ